MHHTELTRAEPLAFFISHENACKKEKQKNIFSSYLNRFPTPTPTSTGCMKDWEIHFHERWRSSGALLGEENCGWAKGDTHVRTTGLVVWQGGLCKSCVGCWWGAGSQGRSVIWLWSMWPRLSFLAGLSTSRVRHKGSMPLIPVMPTCLKTSHLLSRPDTHSSNQSDHLESSCSHRRTSHSCAVHLTILLPYCRHLIYFPFPLLYLRPQFVTYFMALIHGGTDCCYKQGAGSAILWHHRYIRCIRDVIINYWE